MATFYESRKKGRKDAEDALYLNEVEPPATGNRVLYDKHKDSPRGFGYRVTKYGGRSFVLRYRADNGKYRVLTIGEHPTWSLTAARERGRTLRQQIDDGTDILEQRRIARDELTVAHVADKFFVARADKLASGKDIRSTLNKYLLPRLGDKKITEVRRRDVIAVVEDVAAKHGRTAALLLTYTKQLFGYAEDREIIEANPIASLKASKVGPELAAKKRARVLDEDEIAALWHTTEPPEGMHKTTLLALKLILVTGQRPGEVAGLRWDEIQGKTWTIPAERRGKTEDAHTVPLTDTALEILKEAEALGRKKAKYVFERRENQALEVSALGKAVKRCANDLGNAEKGSEGLWRPHDLRRTMRTGLAAAGVSETVAEVTIGHVRQGIAGVYDRHGYDHEKRAALEAWERRLLRFAAGEHPEDNVVSLDEARV